VCDVSVWAGSRLVPCISIYITHKPGISLISIKFLSRYGVSSIQLIILDTDVLNKK